LTTSRQPAILFAMGYVSKYFHFVLDRGQYSGWLKWAIF